VNRQIDLLRPVDDNQRRMKMHLDDALGKSMRRCLRQQFRLTDLAVLDSPEARGEALNGAVEDWATESLLAARQAYQVPETGVRLKSGQKLGDMLT
jgi:hypothetical protein